MRDDEQLVIAARTGEPQAYGSLVQRWFDRCWDVAWRILHDADLAADVAQDTLTTAWQRLDELDQPASFGGWVLRIARNRALDRLKKERRAVPMGEQEVFERPTTAAADDPVAALTRQQQQDLVWAAAAALGERDASVLDLHLRHGLEPKELAAELGVSPNAAHQMMFRLRDRLGGAIRGWLLWRMGQPRCDDLRADLAAAGLTTFGADTVRAIQRHADRCEVCGRERDAVVAPAAMFGAVPLLVAPAALAAEAAAAMADAGVPVPDPDVWPRADGGGGVGPQPPSPPHRPWHQRLTRRALTVGGVAAAVVVLGATYGVMQALQSDTTSDELAAAEIEESPEPDEPDEPAADDLDDAVAGVVADESPASDPDGADQAPTDPVPADGASGDDAPDPDDGDDPDPGEVVEERDPPAIEEFDGEVVQNPTVIRQVGCPSGETVYRLWWTTSDADTVTLTAGQGPPEEVAPTVDPSDDFYRCARYPTEFTLRAIGPDETVEATVQPLVIRN